MHFYVNRLKLKASLTNQSAAPGSSTNWLELTGDKIDSFHGRLSGKGYRDKLEIKELKKNFNQHIKEQPIRIMITAL